MKFGGHVTLPEHDTVWFTMGSRLLNGSPQLSVRVTLFPLIIIIVLLSTVTPGTIAGTPVTNNLAMYFYYLLVSYVYCAVRIYIYKVEPYQVIVSTLFVCVQLLLHSDMLIAECAWFLYTQDVSVQYMVYMYAHDGIE